jgi:hypothetical protein
MTKYPYNWSPSSGFRLSTNRIDNMDILLKETLTLPQISRKATTIRLIIKLIHNEIAVFEKYCRYDVYCEDSMSI